jgi:ribose 5-phosphate isomerase A
MAAPAPDDVARNAAAELVCGWLRPDATVGLGSGRGVRAVIAALGRRFPTGVPLRAVVASSSSDAAARAVGIEVVTLDDAGPLEVLVDGADEVDPGLALLKGGGGALLHEKILVDAAGGVVIVAEAPKRVARLGLRMPLPVEVVRFGWRVSAERVAALVGTPVLRTTEDGSPFVTEEGHFLLDAPLGPVDDLHALDHALHAIPGVVEHGLFLDVTHAVVFGRADGGVDELRAPGWRPPGG